MPILFIGSSAFGSIGFSFGFGGGSGHHYKKGHHYKHGYYRPYHYRHGYYRPHHYYRSVPQRVIIYSNENRQYDYSMPSNLVTMKTRQYNMLERLDNMNMPNNDELAKMVDNLYYIDSQYLKYYDDYENALKTQDYNNSQRYRDNLENRMTDLHNRFMEQYRDMEQKHRDLM